MPRHRTFTALEPADEGGEVVEPCTFEIHGRYEHQPGTWTESFTTVTVCPSGVLDDLLSSVVIGKGGKMQMNATSLAGFMRGVLIDPDVERFEVLIRDKERILPLEELGDIVQWLTEELTDRPTGAASS